MERRRHSPAPESQISSRTRPTTFEVRAQNAAGYSGILQCGRWRKRSRRFQRLRRVFQATAISSSQVNLTWTNNAPDATAIRVEYLPASATTFTDIGAATTLTNSPVTNLQPNTTYSFRVRAQNAVGIPPYSNLATVTTQTPPVNSCFWFTAFCNPVALWNPLPKRYARF